MEAGRDRHERKHLPGNSQNYFPLLSRKKGSGEDEMDNGGLGIVCCSTSVGQYGSGL